MTIIVVGVVGTAAGVFLLWAAWWIYRGTPKHGKHRTTLAPTVAAHHPFPRPPWRAPKNGGYQVHDSVPEPENGPVGRAGTSMPSWLADLGPRPMSRDDASAVKAKIVAGDLGPDTETWPAPRHTHRDPTTGRYTRREQ